MPQVVCFGFLQLLVGFARIIKYLRTGIQSHATEDSSRIYELVYCNLYCAGTIRLLGLVVFFQQESFFPKPKKVIKNEDCFGYRVLFDVSSNPSSLIVFSPHVAKRPVKWSVETTRAERSGAILTSRVGGRNNANAETISIFNNIF